MPSTLYADPAGHGYLDRIPADRHHRAVLAAALAEAGLSPGATVVEIGAGSGRYTALLVAAGFRVIATEPDPTLAGLLRRRFATADRIEVRETGLGEATLAELAGLEPDAVLGFHVLHHLDAAALSALDRWIRGDGVPRPRGVAFLEPNPFNPLYILQILVHPAMRFREELGLWRAYCGPRSPCPSLAAKAHLGLLPPDALRILANMPLPAMRSPGWAPWSAYRLIGRSMS